MVREQQAQPIAIIFFTLGIMLGVAMFFSAIAVAPTIRDAFVPSAETSMADNKRPVNELYRQAGRTTAVDTIRM